MDEEKKIMLEAMQVLFGDDWDENDRRRFVDLQEDALNAAFERGKAVGMEMVHDQVATYLALSDRLLKVKPRHVDNS